MADQGKALWATLKKEDFETVAVASDQYEGTVKVNDLEEELSSALANIEQRAVIAFEPGTPVLRRYSMKVLRDYVAMAHHQGDASAAIAVVDPDPSAVE
ncbi:MAG: hypothetical protein GY822_20905 [Deltaproteobacteria bacterium]|nr:hypothetical protein [Deltaproteobacteria bacterium]